MAKIIKLIDTLSDWTGKTGSWLGVILVVVVTYEVMMRYLFNRPSLWAYEVTVMLAASLYILAFAYTHRHKAHVRVDMIYAHLPNRGRAIIDVLGDLFLFFPFIFLLTNTGWEWMTDAWRTNEKMATTGWYPPAGPLRTIVFLGIALFALQGISQFLRDVYQMVRNRPYD